MALSFLVPAFLIGLLSLAVPVLIHLSRRQTRDPVQFPSLMFLKKIPHQAEQRRQIHRWPLLLLRCAAIALLVLAFARPFLAREGMAATTPTQGDREVVVLLDRSYSMGLGDRWERAVQAGMEAVDGLVGNDRGTVILFDSGAETSTESTLDRAVLRGALQAAEPGSGTTRYAPALRYAGRLLTSSPLPRHEIVIISDFQASGWDADGGETSSLRLPVGTVVTPISVAEVDAEYNVTINNAELERSTVAERERVHIRARLTGSGTPPPTIPVVLEIDGRPVETMTATFGESNSATVSFSPLTLPESSHTRGTLRVGPDALPIDNELHFVLSADQRMNVLIIEGSGAAPRASYYLERALSIGDAPGFRVTTRRGGQISPAELASNAVIILHQTGVPAGAPGDRLREHVEQGGGVILLLGDNVLGDWPGVLPSVPAPVDRTASGGTTIGYMDTGHPVFEAFAGPRSGDFSSARVYRYRPLPSGSFPRILARFGDGGAALAERPVGAGRVLVWTSTLDSNWNDLALQPVFLPFLHQLVKYAAGYTPPESWMTIGDPFDLRSLGPAGEEFNLAVAPDGTRLELGAGTRIDLARSGFYELRNTRDGQALKVFAVNIDPLEAEPTAFDPEELRTALLAATETEARAAGGAELTLAERERQQNGWWYLVIVAFAMLILETLFSNRMPARSGNVVEPARATAVK